MPYDNDKVDTEQVNATEQKNATSKAEQVNATEVTSNYKVFCVFSMCVFQYFTGLQGSKQ